MANKQIRFTDSVTKFILDKMTEGFDIAQICYKWPDKVPHAKSIYRKSLDDAEFAAKIDQAYTVLLMHRLDELHSLSGKLASEVYPNADWREAEAALKRQIDEAKFVLGKMAPVLSKRFNKTEKIELSGQALAPQIAIVSYLSPTPISVFKSESSVGHQVDILATVTPKELGED